MAGARRQRGGQAAAPGPTQEQLVAAAAKRTLDAIARPQHASPGKAAPPSIFVSAWFIPTLRLAAATVLGSLFTLLGPVGPLFCFTGVFAIWVQTQICVEPSVGTALNAAGLLLGSVGVSAVTAGVLGSLAMLAQAGAARTAAQCCLGVAGLLPFAVIRAGPDPTSLNSQGILSTLFYGMTLILGQFAPTHGVLWKSYVGGVLQALCGASAASIVATLLVLPSLASEKVPGLVTALIRDTGAAISSGSLLLAPSAGKAAAATTTAAIAAAAAATQAAEAAAAAATTTLMESTEATVAAEVAEVAAEVAVATAEAAATAAAEAAEVAATAAAAAGTGASGGREAAARRHALPPLPCTPPQSPVAAGNPSAQGPAANQMEAAFSLLFEDAAEEAHDTYIRLLMAATRPTNMLPIDPLMSDDEVEGSADLIQAWYRPAVAVLRQRLAAANALLPAASVEPAWLTWTCSCMQQHRYPRFRAPDWQRLMAAVGVLVSRVASLECVLEEGRTLNRPNSIISTACHMVFALSAANAAKLSLQLEAWHRRKSAGRGEWAKWAGGSAGAEWLAAKALLQDAFRREIGEYWQKVQHASKAHPMVVKAARPTTSLMFLGCLAVGMMAAAEELEAAVEQVINGSSAKDTATASGLDEEQAAGPLARASRWLARTLDYLLGWLSRLIPLIIWLAPWRHLIVMRAQLSSRCSRPGVRQLLSQRYVQAGFKFWLACSVTLVVILVLDETVPLVAQNLPVFGFIATVAAMRERVESTLEKIFARVVGTVLGATVGFGIMSSLTLANSPGALAGFLIGACLLLGPWAQGHLRLMIGLMLWTFAATILCQFNGCCGATQGHISAYISRLVSVAGGVMWTAALNRVLLPWRGSAVEIESMAEMVKRTVSLMRAAYEVQYEEAKPATAGEPQRQQSNVSEEAGTMGERVNSNVSDAGMQAQAEQPPATINGLQQVITWAAVELSSMSKSLWTSQTDEEQRAAERRLVQDPNAVAQVLGAPLVKVQKQMEREGVPWKSGLLAVPQLARDMLKECGRLLDAMEALQLAAIGKTTEDRAGAATATAIIAPSDAPKAEAGCQVYCELGPAPGTAVVTAEERLSSGKPAQRNSPVAAVAVRAVQPSAAAAAAGAAAASEAAAGDDIMFVTFVQPLDGPIRSTLQGAELLAVLLVAHCRSPDDVTRAALEQQIQDLMELRTAVWSALVNTRKQRLKAIRSSVSLMDMRSTFLDDRKHHGSVPRRARQAASEQARAEAAAELVAVQHSDIAVKYLAVVFAMYKVNNRLMTVARMVLDYGESESQQPSTDV